MTSQVYCPSVQLYVFDKVSLLGELKNVFHFHSNVIAQMHKKKNYVIFCVPQTSQFKSGQPDIKTMFVETVVIGKGKIVHQLHLNLN